MLATWSSGKVGPDCHVKVGRALYSVPWRLIGQQVHARAAGNTVQVLHDGKVVATHVQLLRGRATDFEHYPAEKIAFHMRTPAWCRQQAEKIGPATAAVIGQLMEVNALHRLRSAQGIIGLAGRAGVGDARLEAACDRALRLVTRATAPSRASSPPAPKPRRRPQHRPHPTARRSSADPTNSSPKTSLASGAIPQLLTGSTSHRKELFMTILDPSLRDALRTLKLTGMLETLDARLAQTRDGTLGHLDFLQVLCEDEIGRRESAALTRRIRRARFEEQVTLEGFDFAANPKVPAAQIRDLAALRWLAAGESVILFGPVGVGKTHVAQALGHLVARRGGEVRFAKTSRVLADLAGGHADRTWGARVREYTRPAVLILDDFALREHTAAQADDLYELISDRAVNHRPLILTSNRKPLDWYPLFPNPVVAESLLDRLINTSHQAFMDGPSYRPRKRPGRANSTPTPAAG